MAAFNRMQERLRRFLDDRTRMLAAVSHDLRTPITSLRLRAEFVEDDETRARILATLDEMQAMVEATLAFAREEARSEPTRIVDLAALVESTAADLADLGAAIEVAPAERLPYGCRPVALRRALRNLLENAVRYGERCHVRLEHDRSEVRIIIEDEGPGIPEDQQGRVFEPFVRLEESRSAETGGIGLGLAIARSIARAHGGDIRLQNLPGRGLRVSLSLPSAGSGS
jgi:signal transduction histidine kinase